MFRFRRTTSLGVTAAAAAATFALTAVPASAITPPTWPSTGHIPLGTGCAMTTSLSTGSSYDMRFTDTGVPVVEDVFMNGGTVAVVPPTGGSFTISAKVTEACSGANIVQAILVHGASYTAPPLAPASVDVFHGTWAYQKAATPDDAGVYRLGEFATGRRYDSFILDADFHLTSSVPYSGYTFVVGPWSVKKLYVLRQTTLAVGAPASVKKGKQATITGLLKYATIAGFAPDNGEKIIVQTRVGTAGPWVTRATLTAISTGAVSIKLAFTKKSQVRLVHTAVLSGRFTAAVSSAVKTINVT
jgi:hypothetical protein